MDDTASGLPTAPTAPQFDPDAFISSGGVAPASPMPSAELASFDPDSFIEDKQQEKYGGLGQQALAGLEGAAQGIAGPLATLAEKHVLGVPEEDILGRAEANPVTHGAGEVAGFVGSALTGVGAAPVIGKVGTLAKAASGIGELSTGAKIGSMAVQMAAENMVMQGSDEVSKMILNDPDASAETAISNIGLAGALGGVAGGAFGAVNPIWNATLGPQLEKSLATIKGHIDGSIRPALPDAVESAFQTLGVEADPLLKAAMAGDKTAMEQLSTLRYGQNARVTEALDKTYNDVSESVMKDLGISLPEAQVYSKNEAGHALEDTFLKEFKAKYAPQAEAMEARNAQAAHINVSDNERLDRYGKIIERGMDAVGTDSPQYKLYDEWGNRLLSKETVGGIDQLKTEIGNDIAKAYRAGDNNVAIALKDIKSQMAEFQEHMITRRASEIGEKGVAESLIAERAAQNASYANFAKMSEEMLDHIGAGNFKGAGSLMNKIESIGAENLLKKFSSRNNADIVPFLAKNFPETLDKVRKQELLDLIKPAITSAKGENPIDVKKLKGILDKTMAGNKDLAEFALSPAAIEKINAAETVLGAIPGHKDSGTSGGLAKLLKGAPSSALAAVAMLGGHNPIAGGILGHLAEKVGREVPDNMRLAYLTWLGSDKPISGAGFKAAAGFMKAATEGTRVLDKATKAVFVTGGQVLPDAKLPNAISRAKLDRLVVSNENNPNEQVAAQESSHVGHYMPNHQTALSQTSTSALAYLQSLKPKPYQPTPLDKPIEPSAEQEARYNRALDIAQSPAVVLQHVKDGTLQQSDISDLHNMYPALYKQMSQRLTNHIQTQVSDESPIPYNTRVGISLFLGQPLDSSMLPANIQAAQMVGKTAQAQQLQQASMQSQPKLSAKAGTGLNKMANSYQTSTQQAEHDRSSRK